MYICVCASAHVHDCVHVWIHTCHSAHVQMRGLLTGFVSLLPLFRFSRFKHRLPNDRIKALRNTMTHSDLCKLRGTLDFVTNILRFSWSFGIPTTNQSPLTIFIVFYNLRAHSCIYWLRDISCFEILKVILIVTKIVTHLWNWIDFNFYENIISNICLQGKKEQQYK